MDLYNQYLGRLYENAGYGQALRVQRELAEKIDIDSLKNQLVAAAYYLGYADVAQMVEDLNLSSKMLKKAHYAISKCDENMYRMLKKPNTICCVQDKNLWKGI